MRMTRLAAALVAVVMTAGCGVHVGVEDDKEKPAARTTATPSSTAEATPGADVIEVEVDAPPPDEPCNGKPGVDIPAVDAPEVDSDPVTVPDQKLGGETVPGFVIPGVRVPALHVPAQCAEREEAPAGCIGAVTIPAATIPGLTLPEVRIPGVEVAGRSLQAEVVQPAVMQPAVTEGAQHTPVECAQKVAPGEYRPSVYQTKTYRTNIYRTRVYRPSVYRPRVCLDGECLPPVTVPPITVQPVTVPPVTVQPTTLQGRRLPEITSKCVKVFQGSKDTAYNVCSDVLFDFDKSDIRPDAEAVLRQVVGSLNKRFKGRDIQVDGHTDSQGSDAYNDRLSVRRAESVKRWLAQHGIAAGRISTHGYGESEPVESNASAEGRQHNRRVVIGVAKG
jgi:outer membrane protein OmpA-like peptidoglycan-associated protein